MRGFYMTLIEKQMNLFDVDEKYYLAHCISADFKWEQE